MSKLLRTNLLIASALGAAASATPASLFAQTDAAPPGELETVVVTAQRRAESAQDVPISIVAYGAEHLEAVNVQSLPQIAQIVPGLQFQAVGAASVPYLRGVGASTTAAGAESTVPLVVDGVYMSAQGSSLMALSNIESIEVDKGPQGTLFGRNATGGVIQVRTRQPTQESQLDITAGLGNYQTYEGTLYGTAGLSDTLAADIALSARDQQEGFGTNLFDGSDVYTSYDYTARSKWLWTPSDATELTVIFDYARLRSQTGFATRLPRLGELGLDQRGNGGFQYSGGFYDVNLNFESFNVTKTYGGSIDWLQELGFANLRSISAYHEQEWEGHVDFDLGPNHGSHQIFEPTYETFSQELQLLSKDDAKLQWVLGAFYYSDVSGYHPVFIDYAAPNPILQDTTIVSEQDTKSWSVFGETKLPLGEATRVTLGLRYTSDDRDAVIAQTTPVPPPASVTQRGSKTFSKMTYRAALDHRFGEDVLGYVQVSRGFKSGFFNTQTLQSPPGQPPSVPLPVDPEVLDAYEIGIKSDVLNNRLRANLSAFYYDYQDQQANAFLGSTRILLNAAESEIYGLDFEFVGLPTDNLQVSLVGSYLHARYSEFPNAPRFTPVPPPGVGNIATPVDAKDNDVVNSPTFSGTFAVQYTIPVGARQLELNANAYYNGGYFFDFANTREQDAYTLVNASVKWAFGTENEYDLTLWGSNLLDEEVWSSVNQVGAGPGGLFGGDSLTVREPRMYGIRFGAHF
jgi:iron complex outermembrane recepter protein